MAEDQSEKRTCEQRLVLFWYGNVETLYDVKAGLKRSLFLKGRIHDPHASAFHDKAVHLTISSSSDSEWLNTICARLGAHDACGAVRVRAGVEPERVEPEYDEPYEIDPVQIRLQVSADAFEAICRQMADTNSQQRVTLAKVTLVGASLPESDDGIGFVDLKDLDVSQKREYAVGSFGIEGGYIDHLRGRIRPIERGRDEAYGASIRILITKARYELSVAHGRAHSVSCKGRVVGSRGEPYDCANVTIDFVEHLDAETYYESPRRFFFGEFNYSPERKHFPILFKFDLLYVSENDWTLLAPLLTIGAKTRVFLIVVITNEKAELLAATDELRGNVRNYSFEVFRTHAD